MVKDVSDPESFEEGGDRTERLVASAEVHKDAWARTLEDMSALADERREAGWTVVEIQAGSTGPTTAGMDVTDTFGITFVVPGNTVEPFEEALEAGEFPRYDVYRQEVEGRVFVVVELLDPETETAIMLAGNFLRRDAGPVVTKAKEAGKMYTHVRTLDKTHLGSFEHEGYLKFFPEADRLVEDWKAETDF